MMGSDKAWPPILRGKNHGASSVFTPDALLREARRQKRIETGSVPEICFLDPGAAVLVGATWTTDAPFRETAEAIEAARAASILAVEMEAAALYAFAITRGRPVLCLAHVTNQMAVIEGDFEKGIADGAQESLDVLLRIARRCAT